MFYVNKAWAAVLAVTMRFYKECKLCLLSENYFVQRHMKRQSRENKVKLYPSYGNEPSQAFTQKRQLHRTKERNSSHCLYRLSRKQQIYFYATHKLPQKHDRKNFQISNNLLANAAPIPHQTPVSPSSGVLFVFSIAISEEKREARKKKTQRCEK